MHRLQRNWAWWVALACVLAGVAARAHDALVWNPYWGYDGGAHLDYVRVLLAHGRLPTLAESYVAWHEPLFYLLAAPLAAAVGTGRQAYPVLGLLPLAAGLATLALAAAWTWQRTRRPQAVAIVALLLAGLPVAVAGSVFFSNEGLAQLLILLAVGAAATATDPDRPRRAAAIGVLLGLALLAKLTAWVAFLALVLWYCWRAVALRSRRPLVAVAVAVALAVALASPWLAYRTRAFGGFFTNPYEAPLAHDRLPASFFLQLDRNPLVSPFFPAGSRSFWSMAFASAVTDYDAILIDPDRTAASPATVPAGVDRTVTPRHAALARDAVFLALMLAPLFLLAAWRLLCRTVAARRRPEGDALLALFLGGSVAALALNVVRNGGLDRGNLKAFFVLAAVVLSVILVADEATAAAKDRRLPFALTAYALVLGAAYAAVTLVLCWI